MNKAYRIKHNLDHFRSNNDYDVWQVVQNRKEKFKKLFWKLEPIKKLPPHRFEGKFNRLKWLDYPCDNFNYPIVSRRMADLLVSIGKFQCQIIPLEIYDYKSEEKTNNFVFLHLLECIEALDREKTKYYEGSKDISEFALKEPIKGYPPLFMIEEDEFYWFVSAEAKEALEAEDIKGVSFVPLIAS